ncbi:MAG TPA: cyclic nucleotide-binding domain-containing protein, partial [Terriglobia bacterium]|nr:cyclic nucleotide-binding domain-containing protein [Terriglobia bacterium]
ANSLCALTGGIPGSGVAGATLVNVNSGARTKFSSILEGVFVAAAFLLFGRAIGRIPIAALSGILIVIAFKMIDWDSVNLLRQKSTVLDFLVISTVILIALRFDLIMAAGAGLALSILLFIREQVRGTVIRRKLYGDQISSKQHRLAIEKDLLRQNGKSMTVCQLQGSLFFGTTDQLLRDLDQDLKTTRYLILDMSRVQSVDFTAVHMLQQIEDILKDQKGQLVFASLPACLPTGKNLERYFRQLDLIAPTQAAKVFETLDEALEWAEDRILDDAHAKRLQDDRPLELGETDLFKDVDREALDVLDRCSIRRSYAAGEPIFSTGDCGDELFLIRKGLVRISLQLADGRHYNLTTFARGDFFGDMAFLDQDKRSADAIAVVPTEVFVISRQRFDEIARELPEMGTTVFAVLARALSVRLRYADSELRGLQEA